MINLILFGSFFVMLLLNIPIAVSLGMSSIFALLFSSSPLTVVPTNVYSGMAKFLLLAIPFFVLSGNIMAKASKGKVNPLIGSAGVSAVPMAARVSQMVGQKANPANFLLMHAMGPNVAGVIGSAIAAGVLMALFG